MSELIYVQPPAPKTKLDELLNNPPLSVLAADHHAVKWLDALKREAEQLRSPMKAR